MDVVYRAARAIPWNRLAHAVLSRPAEQFLAGGVLGVTAVCGVAQTQAHWGTSGPLERGVFAAVALGLWCGCFVHRRIKAAWAVWLMVSATLSLVLPWWLEQISRWLSSLPGENLAPGAIDGICLALGLGALLIPASCWAACVCAAAEARGLTCLVAGAAGGAVANAFVLGPWLGAEITAIACAAVGLAAGYRALSLRREAAEKYESFVRADVSPIEVGSTLLKGAALFGCGGALVLSQSLTGQMTPQTVPLQHVAWGVMAAGIALGRAAVAGRRAGSNPAAWGMLLIIAGLSCNGWLFEAGVRFRLWSAAYVTSATLHQLAMGVVLAIALLPISLGGGLLLGRARSVGIVAGLTCLILGAACFRELAPRVALERLETALLCAMTAAALATFAMSRGRLRFRWQTALATAVLACGVLSPVLQPAFDPALPAKLLFSTSTFLAYRQGWDVKLLCQLDDSRLVATAAGRNGPQTVWKSRGTDLMLRDCGIPRCQISCRPDRSPQMAPEVLQGVFPLVAAGRVRSVLLLGSSGGIPLSTCLSFPVEQVTCVEPDEERIALIRGPIADERGYDPFADERVTLDRRPVELAARMSDGGYDVILSSPPQSAVVSGAPHFTQEFYQSVSAKLSPAGIFCQRFEGVDYGPQPLQMVTKSLLASFRDVVAVEIGVGEFLFLATNSADGLAPADLPERLETNHVRRVLARCGLDWSTLLTLGAWDREALAELATKGPNTAANCRLAFVGPRELLRWGPKLAEVQQLLTQPRQSPRGRQAAASGQPALLPTESAPGSGNEAPPSRRSRYLDWLGEHVASKDLLRRFSEVAGQTKIVLEGPDSFWLDYRKALREELQQRPRTEIRQVAATDVTERRLHPEDERRKDYFTALGAAGDLEHKSLDKVLRLLDYFEPYDPLLSYFAHQEAAELLALYGRPDPALELNLRLHVIYFAPHGDRSLRNVHSAIDLLLRSPEAIPDPQDRFDALNGLLQTLRSRWEVRSHSEIKSVRLALQDVDRSVVLAEKMVQAMDELVPSTSVSAADWRTRQEVIDRVLLRPLRGYRAELTAQNRQQKARAEAALRETKGKKK